MIMTISLYAEVAFDVTDLGVSAESIALGGSHSSAKTAHAIFINPSFLDNTLNWSADAFHTNTIEDVNIQNISLSKAYKLYSFGLGWTRTGMNDIPKTSQEDGLTGKKVVRSPDSYSYSYDTLYFGTSYKVLDHIVVGGSMKWFSTTLETISGKGFNSDFGLQYIKPSYQLAVSIHNIFPMFKMNYSDASGTSYVDEELPLKLFINGTKKVVFKRIESKFHLQLNKSKASPLLYAGGATILYQGFPYIEGLLGTRSVLHLDDTIMRKSVGLNLTVRGIKFSYAFESSNAHMYNQMHYFSLSLFSKKRSVHH